MNEDISKMYQSSFLLDCQNQEMKRQLKIYNQNFQIICRDNLSMDNHLNHYTTKYRKKFKISKMLKIVKILKLINSLKIK